VEDRLLVGQQAEGEVGGVSALLDSAKDFATSSLADVNSPSDDFMPFLTWSGPYGWGMMPITMMGDDPEKDVVAVWMTTALAVARAEEAVFASCVWAAPNRHNKDGTKVMPSEHEDRQEMAMLVHSIPGRDVLHLAPITRTPDTPPDLGAWDHDDEEHLAQGRFARAVHMAFDLVKSMPPGLIDMLDQGWQEGKADEMIKRFAKVHFAGLKEQMGDLAPDGGDSTVVSLLIGKDEAGEKG
jgi:hypothetical protein